MWHTYEVQNNANFDSVLNGARFPADYHSVKRGAEAVAGDGGPRRMGGLSVWAAAS